MPEFYTLTLYFKSAAERDAFKLPDAAKPAEAAVVKKKK